MLAENLSSVLDVFKTGQPSLIGVDIASTSLKLVELSAVGKGMYRLDRYVVEPLPKDVVADGNILNIELCADVLKRAWKRLGSRNRDVALALPAAGAQTREAHHQRPQPERRAGKDGQENHVGMSSVVCRAW
jgi:Tfp pilus assembly PilM family ATPase